MTFNKNLNSIVQKMFLFFAAFCISVASAFAQDIITGEDIQSPVQEISESTDSINHAAFILLRKNDSAMDAFLKKNDAALYERFHKGVSKSNAGKKLRAAGIGVTGAGIALMVIGAIQMRNNDSDEYYWSDITDEYEKSHDGVGAGMFVLGTAGLVAGQCLIIASIPLSAVGGGLKRSAVNEYEQKHFRNNTSSQPSVNFIFTGNGIGLALRF